MYNTVFVQSEPNFSTSNQSAVMEIDLRILVVEDEQKVGDFIKRGLEELGHKVDHVTEAAFGMDKLNESIYDIIILDVNLPKISGFDFAQWVRDRKITTPILMLTALGTVDDKVRGFDSGADDYLVKPFEFSELMARIKALNKRTGVLSAGDTILKVADLELNLVDKTVVRAGRYINLSVRELALLECFMRNYGKALSRPEISSEVWDINFDTGTNVIDVYVNALRKKLDKDYSPKLIHTIVGVGYIMKIDKEL